MSVLFAVDLYVLSQQFMNAAPRLVSDRSYALFTVC